MANNLPQEFRERILADPKIPNPQGLLDALASGSPSVAIRHNRLKDCAPSEGADLVPWCRQGEYLVERPNFTMDPRFHQGLYYVQDPSSMAIGAVIESLGLTEPVNYLDACAAPGGKTTAAIDALPRGSFVLANEADAQRAKVLRENLMKWGYKNVGISVGPAQKLASLPAETFDIIAADVPCSGEGMMRKDPKAVDQWTPGLVESCARLQFEIIEAIWPLLKPGGHLIYSTCTFSAAEDEAMVRRIIDELGGEQLPLPDFPGVVNGHFYPHLVRGEGLYMALLRKPGDAAQRTFVRCLHMGQPIADEYELKGRDRIPSHALALRADFNASAYPRAEVSRTDALRFLHRDTITLPPDCLKGLTLLTFDGRPLGWVNNLGPRANNLLPKPLRILSPIN
ncbi:MAG: hypothetical protein NC301_00130 [Bacteroides sp.]|nr:hypothetical protein [Bacteroides sp.]MCM1379315.1 hypothetical protein [Bacteroides sp.]MCM1445026.1 hypothetical protein [Prevotella sp.]